MSNDRGFQPILRPGRDEDSLLEALAAKKGVGRLESPLEPQRPAAPPTDTPRADRPSRTGGAGQGSRRPAPAAAPPEASPTPPEPAASEAGTPRARMKAMNLELPDYVLRQLKEQALREDCSVRHIIMRGLGSQGITINPPDLVADGRRRRDPPPTK